MKLIPHAQSAVDPSATAKANVAARPKGANAKNMALRFVAPFAQANLSAHTKRSYRL